MRNHGERGRDFLTVPLALAGFFGSSSSLEESSLEESLSLDESLEDAPWIQRIIDIDKTRIERGRIPDLFILCRGGRMG